MSDRTRRAAARVIETAIDWWKSMEQARKGQPDYGLYKDASYTHQMAIEAFLREKGKL